MVDPSRMVTEKRRDCARAFDATIGFFARHPSRSPSSGLCAPDAIKGRANTPARRTVPCVGAARAVSPIARVAVMQGPARPRFAWCEAPYTRAPRPSYGAFHILLRLRATVGAPVTEGVSIVKRSAIVARVVEGSRSYT